MRREVSFTRGLRHSRSMPHRVFAVPSYSAHISPSLFHTARPEKRRAIGYYSSYHQRLISVGTNDREAFVVGVMKVALSHELITQKNCLLPGSRNAIKWAQLPSLVSPCIWLPSPSHFPQTFPSLSSALPIPPATLFPFIIILLVLLASVLFSTFPLFCKQSLPYPFPRPPILSQFNLPYLL